MTRAWVFAFACALGCNASKDSAVRADAGFVYTPVRGTLALGAAPHESNAGDVELVAGAPGSCGAIDGPKSQARFCTVRAATREGGSLFVVDACTTGIRRASIETGEVESLSLSSAFRHPAGLASDGHGTLFVSDAFRHAIYSVRLDTRVVALVAGVVDVRNHDDGGATVATFDSPRGLVFDRGALFVADTGNHAVRKIDLATRTVSTLATGFVGVWGLAVRADGLLFATDSLADSVATIAPDGDLTWIVGTGRLGVDGYEDAPGARARFKNPRGVDYDEATDSLYVADFGNAVIRRVSVATRMVTTVAGSAGRNDYQDGVGSGAHFRAPEAISLVGPNAIGVGDEGSLRIVAAQDGEVRTLAGLPPRSGEQDGQGSSGRFDAPEGMAWISPTEVAVADCGNGSVRRVDVSTRGITTLAGRSGERGFWDETGRDARFECPTAVAYDGGDWLFVADRDSRAIRAVSVKSRTVQTVAGKPTHCGNSDGALEHATFCNPSGVAFIAPASLFVTDAATNTLRKIDLVAREVSTVAGSAFDSGNADGSGSAARFHAPRGIAAVGDVLYIADAENDALRVFDPRTNVVTTFHTATPIDHPTSIATNGADALLVIDRAHVSKLDLATGALDALLDTAAVSRHATLSRPSAALATSGRDVIVLDRGENAMFRVRSKLR